MEWLRVTAQMCGRGLLRPVRTQNVSQLCRIVNAGSVKTLCNLSTAIPGRISANCRRLKGLRTKRLATASKVGSLDCTGVID